MQPSVDAFLENRPKYLPIGKAAIAACLIPYESQSHLHRKAEQLEWYEYLFQHMADLHGEFPDNKLSVITFNYDRSLEYFLLLALKHSYGLGEREAVSLLDTIPLIHVYGQLGKPDFLSPEGRGYAPGVDTDIIDKAVAEIKILTEASEPTAEFARAHELIANADVLCFLGFGYHPTNWERLRVNKLFGGNLVFGTVYGLGSAEIGQVRLQFSGNIRRRLYLGSDTDDSLAFLRSKRILY